jgi:small subunit ribosomal protein S8
LVNDIISDILTRIRNANMIKHQIVQIPATKMSKAIVMILKDEGFIENFEIYKENNFPYLLISLKYKGKLRQPVICKIKRISKPGLRVYVNSQQSPKILDDLGIAILSTSKGVMTNLKARKLGIGGEVLCYIW